MSISFKPRVYLAGPGVFRPKAEEYGNWLKEKCANAGLDGRFPMDNKIEAKSPQAVARAIYEANVALIDQVQAIVADISPFRGPNMDPGTAWEIGYGIAKGLPVFAWTMDPLLLVERTPGTSGVKPVDSNGWTIENFGHVENLMIACSAITITKDAEAAIKACASYFTGRRT